MVYNDIMTIAVIKAFCNNNNAGIRCMNCCADRARKINAAVVSAAAVIRISRRYRVIACGITKLARTGCVIIIAGLIGAA